MSTRVERRTLTLGADPSVRACEHGVAIGFVVTVADGHRAYCDRAPCIRAARKLRDRDPNGTVVVAWGSHDVPTGPDGVIPA